MMYGDSSSFLTPPPDRGTQLIAISCNKMMELEENLDALRKQGYRLTWQRRMILEVMRDHPDHMTADEIYAEVSREAPEINIATVYRTLQWLQGVGLLRKIDVADDRMHYEYAGYATHHHLVCRSCGTMIEIDHASFDDVRRAIFEQHGFEAEVDHLAIFGRCAECRAANPHPLKDVAGGS
jgi:Fur family transcriptional regulator, ferric uptake regulator